MGITRPHKLLPSCTCSKGIDPVENLIHLVNHHKRDKVGKYIRRVCDGKLEKCNDTFAKFVGYDDPEDCIQSYVPPDHYSSSKDHDDFLCKLRNKGYVVMHEALFSLHNGKDVNVQYSARLSNGGTHIEGVITHAVERVSQVNWADHYRQQSNRDIEAGRLLGYLFQQQEFFEVELENKLLANVQKFILPYLDSLDQEKLSEHGKTQVDMVRQILMNIISPFALNLSSHCGRLTPVELKIADMIRRGMSSKEIANTLCVSMNTIAVHRHRIRKKLGLTNKKINLCTHLMSLER